VAPRKRNRLLAIRWACRADFDFPEAGRGGASEDLPDPGAWPILVKPAGADPILDGDCYQILAALPAVYGVFMSPIAWRWVLVVWEYRVFEEGSGVLPRLYRRCSTSS